MAHRPKERYFKSIAYEPSDQQWDIHNSPARFRVNVQGRRSGKSYSAAREAEPYLLAPKTRGWIVAPTYELGDKIGREIKQQLLLDLRVPVANKTEYGGALRYLKIAGLDSEMWIKSADNPDSLVGEGLDWLIFDEAAKSSKRVWEQYLRPTLSDRRGWALFTTTPEGYNWIYDLYVRGQALDFPDWDSWQHPSWLSPYFNENIEELKRELTDETFRQEYGAEFTTFAGKVFPFDRHEHVRELEYERGWETLCSIDFGYRMPSVGWYQVGRVSGREEVHLIDEISHETEITTEELINRIKAKPYQVRDYFGDPAGSGRQSQSGLGDIEIFRRHGINVKYRTDKLSRDIPAGIDLVRSWFKNAEGDARYFVGKNCTGHIEDYENYRYPEKREDRALKDEPLKDGRHDHGCDETRYFYTNRFPLQQSKAWSQAV